MSPLEALNKRLRHGLEMSNYPAANWVKPAPNPGGGPDGGPEGGGALDILIVGAGSLGLMLAHGLRRDGMTNFRLIDQAVKGREGPWRTSARMRTLRSPKHLTGPFLGNPDLTFRAWYEAAHGIAGWQTLDRIPRTQWMDYLDWYRQVLALPVENNLALARIGLGDALLRADLVGPAGSETVYCRHLILANGRAGFGRVRRPAVFAGLSQDRVCHTEDELEHASMAGETIAVIGGAAAAMDTAASALEAGAHRVHMLIRATRMPLVNKFKNLVYSGFFHGFGEASLADRYGILHYAFSQGIAPPRASVQRCAALPGFQLHFGTQVSRATEDDGGVSLQTNNGDFRVDRVILATGYAIDAGGQPELRPFAEQIQTWGDHYQPPAEIHDAELLRFPYLGRSFEFLAKSPDQAKALARIHLFNFAATLSLGTVAADIPGINVGTEQLLRRLAAAFFNEDIARHKQDLVAYDEPELLGDEW